MRHSADNLNKVDIVVSGRLGADLIMPVYAVSKSRKPLLMPSCTPLVNLFNQLRITHDSIIQPMHSHNFMSNFDEVVQ